jgi:hypothetical protein
MKQTIILIALALSLCIGLVSAGDFGQYLNRPVTANVCNETVYQGILTSENTNFITILEKCTPGIGNVTIRKSCIVSMKEGYECLG